jgi:DNA-binding response OmpR family regulator
VGEIDPVVREMAGKDTSTSPTSVLLIEDERGVRLTLRFALEDEGYRVCGASTGERGLAVFAEEPDIRIVLVDLTLPLMSGLDVCRELRKSSDVPIIVLSARAESHDVVVGLEAGADDYIAKPVRPRELVARMQALVRRAQLSGSHHQRLVAGRIEIRPDEGRVLRGGRELRLTKTELRLLCELVRAPQRLLSREVLLDRVWGYETLGDERVVDTHVHRLRTKIEDDPSEPQHLVTVRGLGYKWEP